MHILTDGLDLRAGGVHRFGLITGLRRHAGAHAGQRAGIVVNGLGVVLGAVDQAGQIVDKAIERVRQLANFIIAPGIQPHRQITGGQLASIA